MHKNKEIVRRYFLEVMNLGRLDALDELLSPDFVFTAPSLPEPCRGPDNLKELVKILHQKVAHFYIHVCDMVADGDTVVTHWRSGGTHTDGSLAYTDRGDITPIVSNFEIHGVTWHKIKDGKIVESTADEDTASLMTQLGVLPYKQPASSSSREANQVLVRRYFNEVLNQGNLDVIDEIIDRHFHFIVQDRPEPFRGREGLKGFVRNIRKAFPDITFAIAGETLEGEKVAIRRKVKGTHKGELFGTAPTNQLVETLGIDIFTLYQGKILTLQATGNDFGLTLQSDFMAEMLAS